MDADGLDSGFARVQEDAWRSFVLRTAGRLGLSPGSTVLEVGCGAGAFLAPLAELGIEVSGMDISPGLIALARQTLPGGVFTVGDATDVPPGPPVDVVLSMGVFLYLADLDEAGRTLDGMVRRARHAVAVLDLPDAACAAAALAARQAAAGGAAAYAARYAGLPHLTFDRAWTVGALRARGLEDVEVADQDIPGYGNAPFRFNVWGRSPT